MAVDSACGPRHVHKIRRRTAEEPSSASATNYRYFRRNGRPGASFPSSAISATSVRRHTSIGACARGNQLRGRPLTEL
jgi:hypothetical protein